MCDVRQQWGTYLDDDMTSDNLRMIDVMLPQSTAATVSLHIQWFRLNRHGTGISKSEFNWGN